MCGFGPLPIVIVIMTHHIAEFNFWSSRGSQNFNWWLSFSLFNFHIDKSQNLFSAFLACAHGPLLSSSGKFHNPRSLYFRALYARRNVYRYPFSYLGTLNAAVWPSKGRNAQWIAVESRDPNPFEGERESRGKTPRANGRTCARVCRSLWAVRQSPGMNIVQSRRLMGEIL
jgi:hypothetical protein